MKTVFMVTSDKIAGERRQAALAKLALTGAT